MPDYTEKTEKTPKIAKSPTISNQNWGPVPFGGNRNNVCHCRCPFFGGHLVVTFFRWTKTPSPTPHTTGNNSHDQSRQRIDFRNCIANVGYLSEHNHT